MSYGSQSTALRWGWNVWFFRSYRFLLGNLIEQTFAFVLRFDNPRCVFWKVSNTFWKIILIGGVTTLLLQIFFFYKIYMVFKVTYPTEMRFSKAEFKLVWIFPTVTCLLKVNNRNTRARCDICSRLTIKIREQCQWRRSGVFIVNFEHILNHILVFLLLTFNM